MVLWPIQELPVTKYCGGDEDADEDETIAKMLLSNAQYRWRNNQARLAEIQEAQNASSQ